MIQFHWNFLGFPYGFSTSEGLPHGNLGLMAGGHPAIEYHQESPGIKFEMASICFNQQTY